MSDDAFDARPMVVHGLSCCVRECLALRWSRDDYLRIVSQSWTRFTERGQRQHDTRAERLQLAGKVWDLTTGAA